MLMTFLLLASIGPEVTLTGIVLARSGRHAATLVSEGRVRPVVAGDRAFGCEVAAILKDRVDIVCSGERRTLNLSAAPATSGPRTAIEPEAERVPDADVTITRDELQARLDTARSQRMDMERRVQLLHDGTLEKDMLDEQARRALNLSQIDEIVIMRKATSAN